MAQVTNKGKLKVYDGTGTQTPRLHTGHGSPNPYPHQSGQPMSRAKPVNVKSGDLPKSDASGRGNRKGTQMPTGGRTAVAPGSLDESKPGRMVRTLKKLNMPPSSQPQVGAFYRQIPELTRSRFISPIMADTQQNPSPGGHLGSPKPNRTPGNQTY